MKFHRKRRSRSHYGQGILNSADFLWSSLCFWRRKIFQVQPEVKRHVLVYRKCFNGQLGRKRTKPPECRNQMDFEMRYNLTLLICDIINSLLFITCTAFLTAQTLNQGFTDQNRLIQDQPAKKNEALDRTGPREIWKSRTGPGRTRTNKFLRISDRFGPVGRRTWRSGNTCFQYLPLKVLT